MVIAPPTRNCSWPCPCGSIPQSSKSMRLIPVIFPGSYSYEERYSHDIPYIYNYVYIYIHSQYFSSISHSFRGSMSQLIGLQSLVPHFSRYLPCVTRPAELQYQFGVEFRAGVGLEMEGPSARSLPSKMEIESCLS